MDFLIFKVFTDVSGVEVGDVEDVIDKISLNKFRYRVLSERGYDSLLDSPQPFLLYFTGVGQILPSNLSLPIGL